MEVDLADDISEVGFENSRSIIVLNLLIEMKNSE
jgi:hypothetical protein